jgi:hypothetical protein
MLHGYQCFWELCCFYLHVSYSWVTVKFLWIKVLCTLVWLYTAGIEYILTVSFGYILHCVCFNLYCGGFILFCNVCMCVCVFVCVCVCVYLCVCVCVYVCVCEFCSVCVCVGFVRCECFGNMYTILWLRFFLTWLVFFLPRLRCVRAFSLVVRQMPR